MEAVAENEVAEEIAQALAPAELLPPGVQQPVNIVDGKPELILPNDHTPFVECAEQCFRELAKTGRFFRQGTVIVELVGSSEGSKLVELTVEAFRSRLETYFTLRSFVILDGRRALRPKRCSQDNAKALLATQAAMKYLPPIQAVVSSPVFAEDEGGNLTVLNQGYHASSGGIFVLGKRHIDTTIDTNTAVNDLLGILDDYSFLTESDKSRCVAGLISPALRFGRLLDADFPLDLSEADQSQTGKSYRMKLICRVYGEKPFIVVLPSEYNTLPNLSENSGFLTIERCSRRLVELDRASVRGEITPPTPPTLLNVQGNSGFSKKLGSVGGVGGVAWGRGERGHFSR